MLCLSPRPRATAAAAAARARATAAGAAAAAAAAVAAAALGVLARGHREPLWGLQRTGASLGVLGDSGDRRLLQRRLSLHRARRSSEDFAAACGGGFSLACAQPVCDSLRCSERSAATVSAPPTPASARPPALKDGHTGQS